MFEKLNGYIAAQMMKDSTQDVATLTDTWFNAMYGEAATAMRTLYDAQNAMARNVFGTSKKGIPTVQVAKNTIKNKLTTSELSKWFGYIDTAKESIATYATSNPELYAKYIERINEEWIAVAYWQMYLHSTIFTNKTEYKTKFREVLGYDASTGTYAKDVLPLERSDMTIAEWVENNFSGI